MQAGSIARPLELLTTSVVNREKLCLYPGTERSFMVFNICPWFFKIAFRKQQIKGTLSPLTECPIKPKSRSDLVMRDAVFPPGSTLPFSGVDLCVQSL